MNVPFIIKYQPKLINDFKMSENLKMFIETSLEFDNLNFLLVGDPGCGKTTLLNIIINMYYSGINMTSALKETHILFINSLKEQGIQFYRNDVKTFCQTKSTIMNKKKIVVLDDIDFINEQSQQVFRNCIDKYSDNVNFLISCINSQKVIESLQSRTTIIKLKNLDSIFLQEIMDNIILKENIDITNEAKDLLLIYVNDSIRLLINYLEKFKILEIKIDKEMIVKLCSNINHYIFKQYIEHSRMRDNISSIKIIYDLFDKGYSVMDILDNLVFYIKKTDILCEEEKYNLLPIICKYIAIFHDIHEDNIELLLLTYDIIECLSNNKNLLLKNV
jgi:DNA polymerase III delta prime subunit